MSVSFMIKNRLRRRLVETPEEHHRPPQVAPLPLVRLSLESPEGFAEGGENVPDRRPLLSPNLQRNLVIVADREPYLLELRAIQGDGSGTRLDGQGVHI